MATSNPIAHSSVEWLEAAYKDLEFHQGSLVPAASQPQADTQEGWLERGDWQSLAAQVGAEKLFFVDRDPVVVFAKTDGSSQEDLRRLYERVWCMSRPQLLFLASPAQLSVFDLTKSPPRPDETLDDCDRLIEKVTSIADVQSKLASYHRERVESGAVFEEKRFRSYQDRADRALIRDLQTVREQLAVVPVTPGIKPPALQHLHSLIGRAIFIRYLEDRKILVPEYFDKVAVGRKEWKKLVDQPLSTPFVEQRMSDLRFLRVLQDKDFTYALFDQLAEDFNGDTFPVEEEERQRIQQSHIDKLFSFLVGDTSPQGMLFFFAYRFDVIPIELISTIYEEFYHERIGKSQSQGSHYTPPALVEFLLAHTLTPKVLSAKPRVLDPTCGSGIFLVESFRRMVRYLWAQKGRRRVSRAELCKILREQIAGMDINEEAVRVAAFSLYLAFLHYQEPREINDERRLPYLKWVTEEERKQRQWQQPGGQFFDVLLHANSFEVLGNGFPVDVRRRFGSGSVTIVVGNPPWGYPKVGDEKGQKAMAATLEWCNSQGRPIGDKELSQAFIHLTLEVLQEGGRAGLLVSSGVFFKHHKNSRSFRRTWLGSARLEHVVNFAHVRHIFFSGPQRKAKGISPFVSVVFEKIQGGPPPDSRFQYWSAKRTATIENTQCVVLNRGDMHWLSQRDCLAYENLWKIYWWGGHRDEALIRRIEHFPRLAQLPDRIPGVTLRAGRGFEVTKTGSPAGWLKKYRELPANCLVRYGEQPLRYLREVPNEVYRQGLREVYSGHRLLVGRGIKGSGVIISRLETRTYCFRNSIHGIRFGGFEPWQEAVIVAIFWSSIARYYYFATAGSWGLWHDEIHLENIGEIPILFPDDAELRDRIVHLVGELQSLEVQPSGFALGDLADHQQLAKLELLLDEAVFDLYKLNVAERDLVREMCSLGLDLFYRHRKSEALKEVERPIRSAGTLIEVAQTDRGLGAYLRTFLEIWNRELEPDGELVWRVLSPPSRAPLLAVCFSSSYRNDPLLKSADSEVEAWREVLVKLERDSLMHASSPHIFTDTFVRAISDRQVIFIKRNEQRFWTRTAAREDAESVLAHLMTLEEVGPEVGGL